MKCFQRLKLTVIILSMIYFGFACQKDLLPGTSLDNEKTNKIDTIISSKNVTNADSLIKNIVHVDSLNKVISPPHLRGTTSPSVWREGDLKTLGIDWNANLISWQLASPYISNELDMNQYDAWIDSKFVNLDKALIACNQYGIKLIIKLYFTPGGKDEDGYNRMFSNQSLNDHFVEVWKKIATKFKDYPALLGYDLVNEPMQGPIVPAPASPLGYLETQTRAAKAVRTIDSKHTIFIEANQWATPEAFKYLKPIDVSNVVYVAHMYQSFYFTHQGIGTNPTGLKYPGTIKGVYYDKNKLKESLQPVRDFELANNVKVYIGEFGGVRWASGMAQWITDCIDIFEEYSWDWTFHNFRESPIWDTEMENGTANSTAKKSSVDTDRKKALLAGLRKNVK